jgi:death-on-curing protein
MKPRIQIPTIQQIVDLHDLIVAKVGGATGIRSIDAIAGAWGRAETRVHYGNVDVPGIAATIAVSIAKAHGFADGNKRAAYGAMTQTLALNGFALQAPAADAVTQIISAASGSGAPEDLADWLRDNAALDPVYAGLFTYDLGEDPAP